MKLVAAFLAVVVLWSSAALAEVPRVVVSIKPIHSLVAAVMGALGSPTLLVRGGSSPHAYSLRPSDAAALEAAQLVFWTGNGMELFLEDSIGTLAPNATKIELSAAPGIELLPIREAGAFQPHEHVAAEPEATAGRAEGDDGTEHRHEGAPDMHFWLDPANGRPMLRVIAEALAAADPANAGTYRANAAAESTRLEALTAAIDRQLAPVRDRPFIVFHDAYQYFERRFGLHVVGSLAVTPDSEPGAQRVTELRDTILTAGAVCVFAEPQFEPAIVATVIEGTPARSGVLDPEGAELEPSPGLYADLIQGLADSLTACLGG